jgi:hypothetical protein
MPVVISDLTGCFSAVCTGDARGGTAWSITMRRKRTTGSDVLSDMDVFHGLAGSQRMAPLPFAATDRSLGFRESPAFLTATQVRAPTAPRYSHGI